MDFTTNHILYGGDYNPDQWLEYPDILEEDIRLMKEAGINTVSMAMFSWAKLETDDGIYDLDWLEAIVDHLYENGISTIMSTPSGARPHWLADKYPEVLRVNEKRERDLFGTRHNHCYTSPAYRNKTAEINRRMAERFDSKDAVILWHISNEYGGECHCPLCQEAFRGWLKKRYGTIAEINRVWNTSFWSHDYQSFGQIESPSPRGEVSIHGLDLDWRRFVSEQSIDFCRHEIRALRQAGARKPVTTNLMYEFYPINYFELAKELDVISWDDYPTWGKGKDDRIAMDNGLQHDLMRSLKSKPFILMESCPGPTNWQEVSKLKRPGVLQAASIQALAHGSESVMYFQIRKGRGGAEKFHGAVIDHYGREDDRTYQECSHLGANLKELSRITGSVTDAPVAVICDIENRWAMEKAQGPRNCGLHYMDTVKKSYWAFRKLGINTDIIDETQALDSYRIVVGPMLYMFRPGFADKVRRFVSNGGTFILTYWSGVVEEHDLCILGGTPGSLMDVFGLRSTEIDGLYDNEYNVLVSENGFLREKGYECRNLCQLLKPSTAETLMHYGRDFYAGTPALTVNTFGRGMAYYVAADAEQSFYDDFYQQLVEKEPEDQALRVVRGPVPAGIEITSRRKDDEEYIFVQNFNNERISYQPKLDNARLIWGQYEYMKPDGSLCFVNSNEEMGFEAYESRIYLRNSAK